MSIDRPHHPIAAVERARRNAERARDVREQGFEVPGGGEVEIRWFRITGATKDGSNIRWTYTGNEVRKASAGYGGWSDQGMEDVTLYSSSEDQQTGNVTSGGVDVSGDDYPPGFKPKPIQTGTRVLAARVQLVDTSVEWWIINAGTDHWGTCEAPEPEE